jgi:hypothetical protein
MVAESVLWSRTGVFRGNRLWIVDKLGLGTWSPGDATFSYGMGRGLHSV